MLAASACALVLAARRVQSGPVESGDLMGSITLEEIGQKLADWVDSMQTGSVDVAQDVAGANLAAFLAMIRASEGTAAHGDPYRVCYGYGHTVQDMSQHPAVSGEWPGVTLGDDMCAAAGFGPGCKSTAAGAYQIIAPTWRGLGQPDFSSASQDAAAAVLIDRRGALADVQSGRMADAVRKCAREWASLPGNTYRQGGHDFAWCVATFEAAGGVSA